MSVRKFILVGIIILLSNHWVHAQNFHSRPSKPAFSMLKTDSSFSFRSPRGYFPSLIHNFGEQASAPFRFNTNQWLMAYGAVYVTAWFVYFDSFIDDWAKVQKDRHPWVNGLSPFITEFGGNPAIFTVIGLAGLSAAFNYSKGLQTCLLTTQAMLTSGVWTRMIKILSGRERPFASYINSKQRGGLWHGPFTQFTFERGPMQFNSSFDSFISGHTAVAFSIATVIAKQYSDVKVVPYICYATATLAGLSRLTEHQHWGSEVFAGALMGYLCGSQVVSYFNRLQKNRLGMPSSRGKRKAQLSVIPYGNQVGLRLTW